MKLPTLPEKAVYENPNISSPRLQGRPDAQVPRDMFGARGWQELGRVGEQVQQFASRAAYIYDDYNSTKANEAANAFQRDFLAWQGEANQKKGKFAENTGEEYQKWSQKSLAGLGKGLNEIQKGRFMAMAQDKMSSQQRWANDYGAGERRTCQISELQATIDVEGQTVFANIGDPDMVEKSLQIMKDSAFSMAQLQGLDEKATMLLMQQAPQKFLAEAISDRIKNGDTGLAAGLLDNYGPQLGGNAGTLSTLLTRERRRQADRVRLESRARKQQAEGQRLRDEQAAKDAQYTEIMQHFSGIPDEVREPEIRARLAESPELLQRFEADTAFSRWQKDAADMGAMLQVWEKTSNLPPSQRLDAVNAAPLSDAARQNLRRRVLAGDAITDENAAGVMTLLRAVDQSRLGQQALTQEDILAAALHGNMTSEQTRQALAYLENPGTLTVGRLDDICRDLGMASEPGQPLNRAQAPAWLYAAVNEDLRRNGLTAVNDEALTTSVTRAFQRHDRELAAAGKVVLAGEAEDGTAEKNTALPAMMTLLGILGLNQASTDPSRVPQRTTSPYYRIGRRPLEGSTSKFREPGPLKFPNTILGFDMLPNSKLRFEHQQFIAPDGANFGFFDTSQVAIDEGEQSQYSFDSISYGDKKYDAECIDLARERIAQTFEQKIAKSKRVHNDQLLLQEHAFREDPSQLFLYSAEDYAMKHFETANDPASSYHLFNNNCQDYIEDVISEAQKIADEKGVSLLVP